MQIEISDATYAKHNGTRNGVPFECTTGSAVVRVTIDGETREFPAVLAMCSDGYERWDTDAGLAAMYPTGTKSHNVGVSVTRCARRGIGYSLRVGRSSAYARGTPRVVGFYDNPANAANPSYRR